MPTAYKGAVNKRRTPQTEAILGENQVKNNAGGFVYQLDEFGRLERFLILGSTGGTYYVTERDLTKENAGVVQAALDKDWKRAIDAIVNVSETGRAPKNSPAIYALAIASAHKNLIVRKYALNQLPKVCRIGTHLFEFIAYMDSLRAAGSAVRKAVKAWFDDKGEMLEYQMLKYQNREGWSWRDILRTVHTKPANEYQADLFRWAVKDESTPKLKLIQAFEAARNDKSKTIALIKSHGLTREMVPTETLREPDVWRALLDKMPLNAMVRNLGNMSKVGILTPTSTETQTVITRLRDVEQIKKSRLHPYAVLLAQRTYSSGQGLRGNGAWAVVPKIVDALDDTFRKAFDNVTPTGKRILLALDVSGSMGSSFIGTSGLTAREASVAMALVTLAVEDRVQIVGFTSGGGMWGGQRQTEPHGLSILNLSGKMRLRDAVERVSHLPFGGTDCAAPMLWAAERNETYDAIVIYTDSETWAGAIHPSQALRKYRGQIGVNTKLIVVGMTATQFTIADPNDPGMLDVVGFDASAPAALSEFIRS